MKQLNINHANLFDTQKVIERYEKKDGVPIKYVCTSDLTTSDVPMDIFYRSTPHPDFGNRYFGIFYKPISGHVMITDADKIEQLTFGMITDKEGKLWYSQSHHDCLFIDEKMIDGGRAYIRSSGNVQIFKVKDGEFVEQS
jgi:hypothetical protein